MSNVSERVLGVMERTLEVLGFVAAHESVPLRIMGVPVELPKREEVKQIALDAAPAKRLLRKAARQPVQLEPGTPAARQKGVGVGRATKRCMHCHEAKGVSGFWQGHDICRACEKARPETRVPKNPKVKMAAVIDKSGAELKRTCIMCAKTKGVSGFHQGSEICRACEKDN